MIPEFWTDLIVKLILAVIPWVEFALKLAFWGIFALGVFGMAMAFPQEARITLIEKMLQTKGNKLIFLIVTVVLGTLVGGILGMLFLFSTFGDNMKFFYIAIISTYFFVLLRILKAFSYLPKWQRWLVNGSFSVVFGSLWAIWPNWITYDLTAFICGYILLCYLRPRRVDIILALMIPVLIYDTWGVLGDLNGKGGAIVQVVSLFSFMPVGVVQTPIGGILGLGDIAIPGMIVLLANQYGCGKEAILGWLAGLVVVFTMSTTLHMAMPATIPLVPFTLFAFLWAANRKKVHLVWLLEK